MPKQIHDKLGLSAGSKLDFELLPDGTVKLRQADLTALSIMAMLKLRGQQPVSIEEIDEGNCRVSGAAAGEEAAMMRIDRAHGR